IAVSGSNIATVWSDSDKGPLTANGIIYFSGSSDNGTTFSPPVQVSSPGRNSGDPSVAFGAAGNIYVVWTDFDISKNNNQDIYYSWSSTNGTSFSAPLNISWNGGISTSARVSSFGGNVSVVWKDDSVLYGLTSVWGSSSTDVYLAGKEERIYHSSDLGKSWTRQNYNQGGSLLSAIWGSSASDVYAAGGAGAILHTTGAPLWTWTAQTSGTTVNLNAVWGSSATDVYAVGAGGAILHTVNSGATWSPQTSNVTADLAGVWGSSASDVYAVGGAGTILYSVTAGANWTATQSLATTLNLNAIWGTGPSDIYIAADNGTIFHSTGNGVWSSAPANGGTVGLISQNLLSIWGATYTPSGTTNSVTVVYAGASGGKVIKKSGTAAWESNSVVIGGDFNVNGLWGVVTPTYTVIYGVQGDGPVMEWNNPSWDPLWPESTQGEIVYRQYPPAGPSYPLAAPVTLSNASKAVPPRTTASPEILPAGSSLWFSWTEGTAGTVGIVHDQSSLYLSVTSNGTAFSPPSTLLASPATGCSSFQIPKMAYDGIGTIYLVLQEAYRYDAAPAWKCLKHPLNFSQVLLASFTIPGAGLPGSLVGPSPISFSSGGAQSPVIAASGTTLAAGWIDTAQNKDDLYLITSPDGGLTFTPPVNFTSPFPPDLFVNNYYNSSSPFLLASGGSFYLGWTQDLWPVGILPGNNEIFFSRF
ncbi:MAG TPA: hypothetical protein VN944_11875, partial [Nitrospiria bacterium]|nr:hypothetical protein [Nitrospiria bacterium]